jgi:hypothetical protein
MRPHIDRDCRETSGRSLRHVGLRRGSGLDLAAGLDVTDLGDRETFDVGDDRCLRRHPARVVDRQMFAVSFACCKRIEPPRVCRIRQGPTKTGVGRGWLAVLHREGTRRGFDSVRVSRHWVVQHIKHPYKEGIAAGSDHAPVVVVGLELTKQEETEAR